MKSFLIVICSLFFCSSFVLATEDQHQKLITDIEGFILTQNFDSAEVYLNANSFSAEETAYINSLKAIAFNEVPSYSDYLYFIEEYTVRDYQKVDALYKFIEERVVKPDSKTLEFDYFRIKWLQTMLLRNEAKMDLANKEYEALEKYLDQFDQNENLVKRARAYQLSHPIVLSQIEKNVETGYKLCEQMKNVAEELKDTVLLIASYYHFSDCYIIEGKLDEYIEVSEEAYRLDLLSEGGESYYYVGNLLHLINALIYKGGNNERVMNLLEELYDNLDFRKHSYYLYLDLMTQLDSQSEVAQYIFNKFKVNNVLELSNFISEKAKGNMNPHEYYYLIEEISKSLYAHGYVEEAMKYKDKEIVLVKELYSQDLAKTLADSKANQIKKEKEKEIEIEKDKAKLFLIIGLLCVLFLLIAIYGFIRKTKQATILRQKNIEIENQKNAIEKQDHEKALLLKEIHHRVKNNFQIVSSLLQLQTKRIEDKDALEIVVEGQNRVKSMALIHQKLYQNDDLTVDFKDYLHELVKELNKTYSNKQIKWQINIDEDYVLDIDTSIPLGLIVNELITNSFKYAFNQQEEGLMSISLIKGEKEHKLVIKDNGVGLPKDFDVEKAKSLGLRLVKNLSKQLHGRAEYSFKDGAEFTITFKETALRFLVE